MRILPPALAVLLATLASNPIFLVVVDAKKSSSRSRAAARGSSRKSSVERAPPVSRRPVVDYEDDDDDVGEFDIPGDADEYDEEEEDDEEEEEEEELLRPVKTRRPSTAASSRRPPPRPKTARSSAKSKKKSPPRRPAYDDDSDYERSRSSSRPSSRRGPPPRKGRRPPPGRSVVRYSQPTPGAFTRGISVLRENLPDPGTIRDAATSTLSAARQTSTKLSSTLYREVKGLTSSELEQVMLKATRPDDSPVKGKHVERLVGVTYQISGRYDIYDAVLRKLWSKMTEKDWRTTIKALYILHRFAADGAPEHAPALKARLRELRRTRDPKRKEKYFNSRQLLAGDASPESVKFRAFMSRYAHYVLLRAQCFGGLFDEISLDPLAKSSSKKASTKPVTSTALRTEHLEAASMLLKAGVACSLKDGEECENTAIAAERVASDLIGLTTAVAVALNRALKGSDLKGADPGTIKRWCEFYSEELLPQSRSMVKKTSAKLDAYGLFLPSRMGASVSPEVLQKGLRAAELESGDDEAGTSEAAEPEAKEEGAVEAKASSETIEEEEEDQEESEPLGEKAVEAEEYDAYDEYDVEEYYDDEEA